MEIILFYLNMIGGMWILRTDDKKKINMNLFLLVLSIRRGLMSHIS